MGEQPWGVLGVLSGKDLGAVNGCNHWNDVQKDVLKDGLNSIQKYILPLSKAICLALQGTSVCKELWKKLENP